VQRSSWSDKPAGRTEMRPLQLCAVEPKLPGHVTQLEVYGSGSDPQGAAEESRATQLQSVGSLKVTIQQSSDSREFGQTDRHTAALHCHVCNLTCRSLQVFQEHLSGQDHLSKLQDITQSIQLNVCPLLDRCSEQTTGATLLSSLSETLQDTQEVCGAHKVCRPQAAGQQRAAESNLCLENLKQKLLRSLSASKKMMLRW
ncbi:hypothetical protein GOODEAATRI_029662, partial [Goodea atripinnis]